MFSATGDDLEIRELYRNPNVELGDDPILECACTTATNNAGQDGLIITNPKFAFDSENSYMNVEAFNASSSAINIRPYDLSFLVVVYYFGEDK